MSHPPFRDEEYHRHPWPDFLKPALEMLYGEYQPDQEIREFIARWGGFDPETLARMLTQGHEEDRLLGICIVGESKPANRRAMLLPFLQSPHPKERWLSALYLGREKEPLALPALLTMLTEFLPSEEAPRPEVDIAWFDELRGNAVDTLLLWDDLYLMVAFRQAFATSVQAEQYLPRLPTQRRIVLLNWFSYQDGLSYALGRQGAFGALMDIPLSLPRQRIAILQMVMGYLQIEMPLIAGNLDVGWEQEGKLRSALKSVLEQRFGLSEEEQNEYLNNYIRDLHDRDMLWTSDNLTA